MFGKTKFRMWKLTKNGERIFSFTRFQIYLKFEFFFLWRTGLSALEIVSIPSSTGTVEGFTLGPFLVALLFGFSVPMFLGGATSLEGGMGEFSREREFSLERLFSFCLFEDRPLLEGLGVSWSISLSALDTCKTIISGCNKTLDLNKTKFKKYVIAHLSGRD